MAGRIFSVLVLAVGLFAVVHAQEIDPDAEVFEVNGGDTVVVNQPPMPAINVNTTNEIHNNIPSAQPVFIPVPTNSAQQIVVPAATTATTAATVPAVVNPVTVNPVTTVNTGNTPARYGIAMMPLGSVIANSMGMGLGVSGLGVSGLGLGGVGGLGLGARMMMPGIIIGR